MPPAAARGRVGPWLLAATLLALTLFTTTTLGAVWVLATRTDIVTDLPLFLSPATVRQVWADPRLLASGLGFSLPVLSILLCHELGHYLACRHYRLPATPPYFLPVPFALGTFGAFIRIRGAIRNRRQLFDVGLAGPLAGFVVLLPFLLLGSALSQPAPVAAAPALEATGVLFLPGRCLALELAGWLFHGRLAADEALILHPFALAAWIGLLATALNLLPLGQLDGGHVLYAVAPRWQRRLALPLWAVLAATGLAFWRGWLVWCVITAVMGLRHPPVVDEGPPLGRGRLVLSAVGAALLVLCFMPMPLQLVPVR